MKAPFFFYNNKMGLKTMQNTLNTRILLKHDTPENWEALITFTPLAGELIVYDGEHPRFKIGDG